ncbi:hypothetical protein [Mycobacterium intracellulare]|uniref:hypothetical protein n=1 Tax=Mycobacterium intracellulare TaxID=1767 RepID=UPI001E45F8CC|nr:hypothetical protein [Mycobacterium intracellulare]
MPTGWKLVKGGVADTRSGVCKTAEQLGGSALAEPDGNAAWIMSAGKGIRYRPQLRRDLTIVTRQSVLEQLGGIAAAAPVVRTNTRVTACGAAIVKLAARARTTEASPVRVKPDENRLLAAPAA